MENEYGNGGVPDKIYLEALLAVVKMRTASILIVQRMCSIGYALSGKIIEWMEKMGYITEFDGTVKAREVLMTREEFNMKYGDLLRKAREEDGVPDENHLKALKYVVKTKIVKLSSIQRECSVGYNHAGKIIEWMEDMGYITEFDGTATAREVLMTKEEFEAKYGGLD